MVLSKTEISVKILKKYREHLRLKRLGKKKKKIHNHINIAAFKYWLCCELKIQNQFSSKFDIKNSTSHKKFKIIFHKVQKNFK